MQTAFSHAAPIIAFMLLALKGGEFALRPHQQQRIQEFTDTFALRLSYVRPLNALKVIMARPGQLLALATGGILFVWTLVYCFFIRSGGSHAGGLVASVLCVVFLTIPTLIATARIGPKVAGWVYGDGRFLPFAARSAAYFFGCWAIIALLSKAVGALGMPHPLGLGWIVTLPLCAVLFLVLLIVVGFGGLWWIMSVLFFLVAASHGLVRGTEILVRAVGAITWRVAEYNKGAWAAIVLLTTFTVGVADFVLHYKG